MSKLLDTLASVGDVLIGDVRATLQTNITPPLQVYGGPGKGGTGLAKLLGIRAGVVVHDSEGREIARVGDPAPFEPLRALLIVGAALAAGVLVVRAVRALRR